MTDRNPASSSEPPGRLRRSQGARGAPRLRILARPNPGRDLCSPTSALSTRGDSAGGVQRSSSRHPGGRLLDRRPHRRGGGPRRPVPRGAPPPGTRSQPRRRLKPKKLTSHDVRVAGRAPHEITVDRGLLQLIETGTSRRRGSPCAARCRPAADLSRWSRSPFAVVGCAVPWNASQSACLTRSRSTKPAFGQP